jgi:hypothetical protein
MIMDIKEIIEDAESVGFYRVAESEILKMLTKFAELTLKRASLSVNEQDAELVKAAKAVVDRWHTPLWKDAPHTAEFINRLENALKDKT